jgi:hypothetical protein
VQARGGGRSQPWAGVGGGAVVVGRKEAPDPGKKLAPLLNRKLDKPTRKEKRAGRTRPGRARARRPDLPVSNMRRRSRIHIACVRHRPQQNGSDTSCSGISAPSIPPFRTVKKTCSLVFKVPLLVNLFLN